MALVWCFTLYIDSFTHSLMFYFIHGFIYTHVLGTPALHHQTQFSLSCNVCRSSISGIILGMGATNESRRYVVTSALIGWAHTQNDPWIWFIPVWHDGSMELPPTLWCQLLKEIQDEQHSLQNKPERTPKHWHLYFKFYFRRSIIILPSVLRNCMI